LPFFLEGRVRIGSVVITFDDGERSVVERALPMMDARGLRGVVYVTTGWIDSPGYLRAEDLRLLSDRGWTIGAHGVTHRFLSDLPEPELERELEGAREDLARVLGSPPDHLSLPGGRADHRVLCAAHKAGYRSLATSRVGVNPDPPDHFGIRRVMVLRDWPAARVQSLAEGDTLAFLSLQSRQGALDLAKRALGNSRYDALRRQAFRAVQSVRRIAGRSSR
jgi:peptidoglycan/xylan/chitin deacetylase (PgdA/CDA1 family)